MEGSNQNELETRELAARLVGNGYRPSDALEIAGRAIALVELHRQERGLQTSAKSE